MAYITGDRDQRTLLPDCLDDYVGGDDPVRAYDAFVEQLDLSALGIEVDAYQVGHPEFEPRAMLKLLVYGYSYGLRSSRKLERATYHNLSFIWLMGGLRPDHKTIARFRRDQRAALGQVLKQCAQVCVRLGLIAGNTLFVDGTKIRANASMKHTWTAQRCADSLQAIEQRIEALLSECEATDQREGQQTAPVRMQRALADQQQLKERIQGILTELQTQDRTALNSTDPEAGRMRSGAQIETGYNCQHVVDDQHGLIVHSEVSSASNDVGQFSGPLRAAQATTGSVCQTACADAGYSSPDDLQKVLYQGVDVVVPIVRHSDFRDHFAYDPSSNTYQCPEGHTLRFAGKNQRHKSDIYAITDARLCLGCPRFGTCTTSRQGRRVERPFNEAVRERLVKRYQQPDARALMRRRKQRAEHPFGHIKHNLGMRAFLMRGLSGVRAEAALAATAFNLRRMTTLLSVNGLVQRLREQPM
jgi:transposase